jgi:hypothetical protein
VRKLFLLLMLGLGAMPVAKADLVYNPTGMSAHTGPSVGPGAAMYPPPSTRPPQLWGDPGVPRPVLWQERPQPQQVARSPVQQHWVDPDCPPGTVAPPVMMRRSYGAVQHRMPAPRPPVYGSRPMQHMMPLQSYRPPVMPPPRPMYHAPIHRMQPHHSMPRRY